MFNLSDEDTFLSTSNPANGSHPFFSAVRQNIVDKVYDFIIIGSGHRVGEDNVFHFWEEICKFYGK
jgi:hypothetical protein